MTTAPLDGPDRPTPPSLAIVIVNFNSWPDCERLVGAIGPAIARSLGRAELIVVDNASDDPPPAGLSGRAGIRVVLCPENAGFAAGVNTAWRRTSARWLLLLNPDTAAGADLVPRVLAQIERYEARAGGPPGVVGFALHNEDGSRQHSVGSFPTLPGCFLEVWLPRSRRKYWSLRRTRPGPVPWVTGACVLVRRRLLDDLGGMDEDFFLYHEEVALCRSARDRGWSVEFDDAVSVEHLRPLQSRAVSPVLRVVTRHSKLLYFLKFRPRWEAKALAWIVRCEAKLRGAFCRLRGRVEEANAWRAIGEIALGLPAGEAPRGVEVRRWAERAVRPDPGPAAGAGPRGRRGRRGRRPPIRLDAIRRSR